MPGTPPIPSAPDGEGHEGLLRNGDNVPQEGYSVLYSSRRWWKVHDYSLVLSSESIEHWLEQRRSRYLIVIHEDDQLRARQALRSYLKENRFRNRDYGDPPELRWRASPLLFITIPAGAWFAVGLLPTGAWLERRGIAQAGQILDGDWWRCVTALTLHADEGHLAGNLVSGYFLMALLRARLPIGSMMLSLTLVAASANFLVAAASDPMRSSRGFSTVVFAALGLAAALETKLSRPESWKEIRRMGPLIAALFIAVFTGVGENADIKAHFFGFGLGALWGLLLPYVWLRAGGWATQGALVAATYTIFSWCWRLAWEG